MNGKQPAKRVEIVSLKMIRESSILYHKRKIASPKDAAELVRPMMDGSDREKFLVLCLDTKNQPVSINICSVGSLNSSIVHPREIFKTAILSNSNGVILAHNHPSMDTTPSQEDLEVTRRLVDAGHVIGIRVIDHIIVGDEGGLFSFKEKGLL